MSNVDKISIALNILPFFVGLNISTVVSYVIAEGKHKLVRVLSTICMIAMIVSCSVGLVFMFSSGFRELNVNYFSYIFVAIIMWINHKHLLRFHNKREESSGGSGPRS